MDKARLFSNYGHKCTLTTKQLEEKFDIQYVKGCTLFLKLWYRFRTSFLIRDFTIRTSKFCRSEFALLNQRKRHLQDAPNIVHPFSPFRNWWEIFMIVISLIVLILLPFTAAFSLLPNLSNMYKWRYYPRIVLDVICLIDLLINFRTGYYNEYRELVLDRKLIAKKYLKNHFIWDLISSIPPFEYNINPMKTTNRRKSILKFFVAGLKIFRMFSCLNYMRNFAKIKNYTDYSTNVFLSLITAILLFHWITCISIVIAVFSGHLYYPNAPIEQSWLSHNDLWNSSTSIMYATALYRTTCIVSYSEYDLIADNTSADQILVCIVWIVSRILYSLLTAVMVQLTRSRTSSDAKYKEMMSQLLQYMHHKQLSTYAQNRLISYYEFRFRKFYYREKEILSTLSESIRQELLIIKCMKIVKNVPFLRGLPESVLLRIVMSLQLEIFLADDVIFKANSKGSSMYFIVSGTVATYTRSGIEVYHLYDGDYFGYVGLTMSLRLVSVVAIETSEIYKLEREDFLKTVELYPEYVEAVERIAMKRIHFLESFEDKYKHFRGQKRTSLAFNLAPEQSDGSDN